MTSAATTAVPTYAESELYDSPEDLSRWPLLAPLLKTWQVEVWEKDHTEFRGCWRYDQDAIRLQNRHRIAVFLAALAGTCAVIFAILQLGMEHRICAPFLESALRAVIGRSAAAAATNWLVLLETLCLILVIGVFLYSAKQNLDHRWRELRFKAEHYRMLKFRFLHDAVHWREAGEEARGIHVFQHLCLIHSCNRENIKLWIHWKKEVLPVLQAPEVKPDTALAAELADYFRERRFRPQQAYFAHRGKQLHSQEKVLRWIGPGLFWGSIVCALIHVGLHIAHEYQKPASLAAEKLPAGKVASASPARGADKEHESAAPKAEQGMSAIVIWAFGLALLAAILPVLAAGVRTWRGAFEFGRNSLRFESMSHHLEHLLEELKKAKTPEAILAILRRGEYAMESEHRAWMRLMMEAEWIG